MNKKFIILNGFTQSNKYMKGFMHKLKYSRISPTILLLFLFLNTQIDSRGIPGIDPSTMATDPDPSSASPIVKDLPDFMTGVKPVEGEKKPDTKTQADDKTSDEKTDQKSGSKEMDPVITFLGVKKSENDPVSVELSWNVNSRNESPIFIARSNKPIQNRNDVMNAYNITSPPLSPQTKSFKDDNLPDGDYYYVVLAKEEIVGRGTLILRPGANVSSEKVSILRINEAKAPPVSKEDRLNQFRITNLTAVSGKDSVVLKWTAPFGIENIEYKVYKSKYPLDTANRVEAAQRIATLDEKQTSYEDRSPDKDNVIFYGVTVTDLKSKREVSDLLFRNSYIEYKFTTEKESPNFIKNFPGALIAVQQSSDTIKIHWLKPENAIKDFAVYRSAIPINSASALKSAELISRVSGDENSFVDKALPSGNYFYGIFPRTLDLKEIFEFYEDRNYTLQPVSLKGKSSPDKDTKTADDKKPEDTKSVPGIKYFRMAVGKDFVKLLWEFDSFDPEMKVLLFRSKTFMRNYRDVLKKGKLLDEVPPTLSEYVDKDLENGSYYYALILEYKDNVQTDFIAGKNYIKEPAVVTGLEKPAVDDLSAKNPPDKDKTPEETEIHPGILYFRMISGLDSVKLIWELDRFDQESKLLLYRSKRIMKTYRDVQKNGKLMDEVPPYIREYKDEGLEKGVYYYALLVEYKNKVEEKLLPGKNYIDEPAIIAGKTDQKIEDSNNSVTDDNGQKLSGEKPPKTYEPDIDRDKRPSFDEKEMKDLERILARTYLKKLYEATVKDLRPFAENDEVSPEVRAKAQLYSGISLYNLKKYSSALKSLSKTDVRNFYPVRSEFWIKRTLEKLK